MQRAVDLEQGFAGGPQLDDTHDELWALLQAVALVGLRCGRGRNGCAGGGKLGGGRVAAMVNKWSA